METLDKAILFTEVTLYVIAALFAIAFVILFFKDINKKFQKWLDNLPTNLKNKDNDFR